MRSCSCAEELVADSSHHKVRPLQKLAIRCGQSLCIIARLLHSTTEYFMEPKEMLTHASGSAYTDCLDKMQ